MRARTLPLLLLLQLSFNASDSGNYYCNRLASCCVGRQRPPPSISSRLHLAGAATPAIAGIIFSVLQVLASCLQCELLRLAFLSACSSIAPKVCATPSCLRLVPALHSSFSVHTLLLPVCCCLLLPPMQRQQLVWSAAFGNREQDQQEQQQLARALWCSICLGAAAAASPAQLPSASQSLESYW